MTNRYAYTVALIVHVKGPEAEWDDVARDLAFRVARLRERNGFRIANVEIDAPAEN